MRTVTIADLRKNFDELLAQTIQFDEPLTVTTAAGNAVILSEANYNSMRGDAVFNVDPRNGTEASGRAD